MEQKHSRHYPAKEVAWNLLAVGAGVLASIGAFYFLFLITAILPQSFNSKLFLAILLCFSAFAGGFTTAVMATRHKLLLAILSSLVLLIVYIDFFDANFTARNYPNELLHLILIFFLSVIGGIAGALPAKRTDNK
jgi:hypothetical protein